ncbi:MAG: FAD-dependent oxidoreductase, partial [Caulobacteraceae bacterium]|nr:FAD-dependent oxidoreductase [Caulobacteraceae bacterium]
MTEKVLIIGAGMAGLCTALSLSTRNPTRRNILILEKDAPPPGGDADAAFTSWSRRGVGQFRHSHAFLARFRNILKRRHPALLQALAKAGCREIGFADMLPELLRRDYRPEPGDEDLVVLTSRRATLECVLRRYVETLPDVAILSGAFVGGLITERLSGGRLAVRGVRGDRAGEALEWRADLVIDAAGRRSAALEWLHEAGAAAVETAERCGILYFTRHYRLRPEAGEPPRGRRSGAGDLGYLKYGVFPADNGCFSVTLAVPEIELELRRHIVRPEVFDRACAQLPGTAAWTDPERADPASKVFGMGELHSRWRRFVSEGQRAVLGFFAVGDSLLLTNPLNGRGCAFAAVQGEILAELLANEHDPAARARLYDARVREALTVYFDTMQSQDRAAAAAARN